MLSKRSDLPPPVAPLGAPVRSEVATESEDPRPPAVEPWHAAVRTPTDEREIAGPPRRPSPRQLWLLAAAMLGLGAGVGALLSDRSPEAPAATWLPAAPAPAPAPAALLPAAVPPAAVPTPEPAEPPPAPQQALPAPQPQPQPEAAPSRSATRGGRTRAAGERTAAAASEPEPAQSALPPGLKPLDLDGGATAKPGRRAIAVDNPYR